MPFQLYLYGLLILIAATPVQAEIEARLDRNPITEQETVTLTLSVPADVQNSTPDFTPLQQDFEILSQSQQQLFSIVQNNSQNTSSASIQWHITLFPKRSGRLNIPSIRAGNMASKALTLTVLPVTAQPQSGQDPEIFMEAAVEPANAYVGSQVVYTVKLFTRLPLQGEAFPEPQISGAELHKLSPPEDKPTEILRNGQRYLTVERRYALYPESVGTLTIPPAMFAGRVIEERSQRARGFFDFFNRTPGKVVRVRSKPVTLAVKPRPTAFPAGADWLPAQNLTLSETWQPDPPVFQVGEPVTRTLTLQGSGLGGNHLPELLALQVAGLKSYPDQAQIDTQSNGYSLLGQRQEKTALIATRPGPLTLPAMRVPWWDMKQNTLRYVTLPARTVEVQPAAGEPAPVPAPQVNAQNVPVSGPTPAPAAITVAHAGWWPWLSIGLGGAWLLTLLAWWLSRQATPVPQAKELPPDPRLSEARRAVRQACRDNLPQAAKQALLAWARRRWPGAVVNNLGRLGNRLRDPAAQAALQHLDKVLYAPAAETWHGEACWQAVGKLLEKHQHARPETTTPLPRLYPQTLRVWQG